ncbi:MAG TPA: hypothetical protein VMV68_10575 [Spirochaetia bacterium]|nr:hypothetical protein [Spirochaetia bacterium]
MGEKKVVTREPAPRYRQANKKGKQKILDEFTQTTVYNRKYACHVLSTWVRASYREVDGKLVRFIVGRPRKPKKCLRRRVYGEAVRAALVRISPATIDRLVVPKR